jgi:hypothetical protein
MTGGKFGRGVDPHHAQPGVTMAQLKGLSHTARTNPMNEPPTPRLPSESDAPFAVRGDPLPPNLVNIDHLSSFDVS